MSIINAQMEDNSGNVILPHSNSETSRYSHPDDDTIDTVSGALDDIYEKLANGDFGGGGTIYLQDETTEDKYRIGINNGTFYTELVDPTSSIAKSATFSTTTIRPIAIKDDATGDVYHLGINEGRIFYQQV